MLTAFLPWLVGMILNLVLFSGGVESTALLSRVSSNDLIITVKQPYVNNLETYSEHGTKILKYYALERQFVSISIPSNPLFVHQLKYFIPIASLIWQTVPFKEIWIGRNVEDKTQEVLELVDTLQAGLNMFAPGVVINHPLDYLTKQEQWDIIPKQLKPLVVSCVYKNECNRCFKCKEKNSLILQKDI